MSRVVIPEGQNENGCWEYTGAACQAGYGRITIRVPGKPKPVRERVHLLLWRLLHGDDWKVTLGYSDDPHDRDVTLDHLCYNRRCCNYDHLEPVTRRVNTQRMQQRRKDHVMATTRQAA
jgi:hypothetical protein